MGLADLPWAVLGVVFCLPQWFFTYPSFLKWWEGKELTEFHSTFPGITDDQNPRDKSNPRVMGRQKNTLKFCSFKSDCEFCTGKNINHDSNLQECLDSLAHSKDIGTVQDPQGLTKNYISLTIESYDGLGWKGP